MTQRESVKVNAVVLLYLFKLDKLIGPNSRIRVACIIEVAQQRRLGIQSIVKATWIHANAVVTSYRVC
jgi:hypothetical protein